MLDETIRTQISKKMQEQHYNVSSLAKKAGMNQSRLRQFMNGVAKYPSVDALYTLAEILNCSLDELTGRKKFNSADDKKEFDLNCSVYQDIISIILPYIEEKGYKPTLNQTTDFIKEAYVFAIEKNRHSADERFVKWIVDRGMDHTLL